MRRVPTLAANVLGAVLGAAGGFALARVVRALPDDLATSTLVQTAGVFGAVETGAALRDGDIGNAVVEGAFATAFAGMALQLGRTRPGLLPTLLLSHGLWDLGQLRRANAAPPTATYPVMCAAFDVALGAALTRWRPDEPVRT